MRRFRGHFEAAPFFASCILLAVAHPALWAAADFKAKGDFTTVLDDRTECASSAELKKFTATVTPTAGTVKVTSVCPATATVSVSGAQANKVPSSGTLTKDGSSPIGLKFDNGQSPERTLTFPGDFKSMLDSPPACSSSGFNAYLSLPNKPLTTATVIEVCTDTVVLSSTALPEGQDPSGGVLWKNGKTPISLSTGGNSPAQAAAGASEKIYAVQGDFNEILSNPPKADPPKCADDKTLKQFTALLVIGAKPAAKGVVKAVCPTTVYVSSTDVPAGGVLLRDRPGTDKPKPVELVNFDGTVYKQQLVSVTAADLRTLCPAEDLHCSNGTPSGITITVAPTDGLKVAAAPALVSLKPDVAVVSFLAASDFQVAMVVLRGKSTQGVIARPLQGTPPERVLAAHGDFKRLTRAAPNECLSTQALKALSGFAYVQGKFVGAEVRAVCSGEVYFSTNGLNTDDKVSGGFLDAGDNGAIPIEFDPVPYQVYVVSVRSRDMAKLCNNVECTSVPTCLHVTIVPGPQSRITLGEQPKVIAIDKDLAVLRFVAPENFEIEFVNIRNGAESIAARPLPGPLPTHGQPNVTFAIVAPDSVMWNFGKRIADRYIVIDLTIKNPGIKKIQVKRSAVWFEVDYASIPAGSRLTTGLFSLNRTDALRKTMEDPQVAESSKLRRYRYGIDHVEQQTTEDWLTLLGVYDGFSNFLQLSGPKAIDVVMAIVSGLSGTAIHSKGLERVLPTFTGMIVPAIKDYVWSDANEKRKRMDLLQQSLSEFVQIPAQSALSTKVFLPKFPIDKLFARSVIIESVRNVHIDLEVISETLPEAVAKGHITAGMTKDQVVQALGIPDSKTDGAGQSSTWVYNSGNYKKVVFDKGGKVESWEARTLDEQVDQLAGKGTTVDIRGLLGLANDPNNAQRLWDDGVIWPKPAVLDRTLRFDKSNKLTDANYTISSDKNNGFAELKGLDAANVESKLASYFPDGKDKRPSKPLSEPDSKKVYNSPDVKGQTVTVTFDKTGKATDVSMQPTKF
jgi:outer membrane protein assembly factor BamE (lipoprotein component of BamABCDE complex)